MILTRRQTWTLILITKSKDGLDIDQLIGDLKLVYDWEVTKQSLQFTIRSLIRKGLIIRAPTETRRKKARRVLLPTKLGIQLINRSMSYRPVYVV